MNEKVGLQKIRDIQEKRGGIYFIYNVKKELMYIGKAINVKVRLIQHLNAVFGDIDIQHNFIYADYILIDSEEERDNAETRLINMLQPPLNRAKIQTYKTEYYTEKYNPLTPLTIKNSKIFQKRFDKTMENFYL